MSYVIVVYSPVRDAASDAVVSWEPSALYSNGNGRAQCFYDLPDAMREAENANRQYGRNGTNEARYSAHLTTYDVYTCDLPEAYKLSVPMGLPEGSEDVPVMTGWRGEWFTSCTHASPLALDPVAVSALPLDPRGPIVLSDGTPCAVHRGATNGDHTDTIYVCPLRSTALVPHRHGWLAVGRDTGLINGFAAASPRNIVLNPDAMRFEVRAGLNGTDRNEWGTVAEFLSGKEASDWIKANRERYAGKSLVVVRSDPKEVAADWREREAKRLADGTYTALPGDWAETIARHFPDHFAHVAQSDKRKVAFTESASSGERDKQKVLSAHLYAQRYLDGVIYTSESGRFVADMMGDSVKVCMSPLGNEDALESVYCECDSSPHGVSSCMSHGAYDYSSPFHPVRIYATEGEVTMAFLRDDGDGGVDLSGDWEASGAIMARCLVWPEGKQYSRVYGENMAARMLRTALENQGYRQSDLVGAKIGKHVYRDSLVMPYLDCGDGRFTDHGEYLTIGGDEYGHNTNGLVDFCEHVDCERCEERVREDDTYSVLTARDTYESWCGDCTSHSTRCSHSGERVSDDAIINYRPSGSRWTTEVAEWLIHDGTICAALCSDGEWREDYTICEDCSEVIDLSETHSEHDECCETCGSERVAAAETEAEPVAEAESVQLAA